MTNYIRSAALGLTAMVLFSAGAQAAGNNHYGIVCLRNDTRANITYQRSVGSGSFETRFLAPGDVWKISHRYDTSNENRSPKVRVRYDADARSGSRFSQAAELDRRAAVGDTCREANVYAFQYEAANRSFITLEKVR